MNAEQRHLMWRRQWKREEDTRRYLHAKSMMATSPSLGSFKEIGGLEQPVMLLRHLALVFGKRTFDPHKVPEEICGFVFTKGLAYSSAELQDAHLYILTDPWPWIVDQGYVAEAPPGSGMYEITAWGWARVESPFDFDMPF